MDSFFNILSAGGKYNKSSCFRSYDKGEEHSKTEHPDFFKEKVVVEDDDDHDDEKKQQQVSRSHPTAVFTSAPPLNNADEVKEWREAYDVKVTGEDLTYVPITSFLELNKTLASSHNYLLDNMLQCGWTSPTLVQSEAIPALLTGRDLICCAPTGSGKTCAYAVPMVSRLGPSHVSGGPRGLILLPTRELAEQVFHVMLKVCRTTQLAPYLLCSEKSSRPGKWKENGSQWDIVVCTPMRLLAVINAGLLSLSTLTMLVLDEADRLFETDFVHQADAIFASCSENESLLRCMFSATIGDRPERLARAIMFDPIRILIGDRVAALSNDLIQQEMVYVGSEHGKLVHFRSMLQRGLEPPVLIFVQNRERAAELFQLLLYDNINVDMLTSDRTEKQRSLTVRQFREGLVWVLITTDLLGRGIDFKGVNMVINWDMPKSLADYVHRVGRTGRAGRPGTAITFFENIDLAIARSIAFVIKGAGGSPPEWLMKMTKRDVEKRLKKQQALTKQEIVVPSRKFKTPTLNPTRQHISQLSSKKKKRRRSNASEGDVPTNDEQQDEAQE